MKKPTLSWFLNHPKDAMDFVFAFFKENKKGFIEIGLVQTLDLFKS